MLSRRLQRARIRAVPAQHSWAALPGPLVNKLLNDQVETPVVLKLTPVPGAGGRDQPSRTLGICSRVHSPRMLRILYSCARLRCWLAAWHGSWLLLRALA